MLCAGILQLLLMMAMMQAEPFDEQSETWRGPFCVYFPHFISPAIPYSSGVFGSTFAAVWMLLLLVLPVHASSPPSKGALLLF